MVQDRFRADAFPPHEYPGYLKNSAYASRNLIRL